MDSSKTDKVKSSMSHHDLHQMSHFNGVAKLPQSKSEHVSLNGNGWVKIYILISFIIYNKK